MILKYGDHFAVRSLQDRYRCEFASHGVLPHRLEFRTRGESLEEHLRTMMSVDLALDAFPYQGNDDITGMFIGRYADRIVLRQLRCPPCDLGDDDTNGDARIGRRR
ncbi:hypothetical protein CA13_37140 [Planctomycetes bacterium CA13]|uniref:Uncharacterized protein n=1 Tax=Novipirellula herctigrandis TaxID=2527986 RepID=A0A5C5Z4H7_9BACT|nr:hypothetical protein CA13_37140 [Planctomycetes bacterium CA13]